MQTMEMSVPRPDKSLSFDRRKVEFPRLAGLKLNPRNAKVHPDAQIGQIARSIERFGFNNPILIDSQNNVLAGEGRLRAARLLGLERVAAREIEGVVEEAVREKLDIADASGQAITDRIERIVLSDTQIRVTLNARGRASPAATVKIPWTPNKTSYDCVPTHSEHKPDPKLVQAIVRAHAWLADLKNGRFLSVEELADSAKLHAKVVRQALRFAFLAPGLIRAILEGRHAAGVTLRRIPKTLPLTWSAHEQMLG